MLRKIRSFILLCIFAQIGVFLGKAIYRYVHYKQNPTFYEVMSAPWHTQILLDGIVCSAAIVVLLCIFWILGHAIKKGKKQ